MKKFLTVLCFVLFAAAVSAACKKNGNEEITLAKPQGFVLHETVLGWEPVDHAGRYELYVENRTYTTEKPEYDLSFLFFPGDYTIQVRAIGEGENIYSSAYSDFTYTVAEAEQEEPTPGLQYVLLPDRSGYEVSRGRANISGRLVIPDEWYDLPVTKIADRAFEARFSAPNRVTRSVRLPKHLKEIGGGAFSCCAALQQIELPPEVRVIGDGAFGNCYALQKINISPKVCVIGDAAFDACYQLARIELPPSVTTIGKAAFRDCYNLSYIQMSDNVRTIGEQAFTSCQKLEAISLPEGIERIEQRTFLGCFNLRWIGIPETVKQIEDDFWKVPWVEEMTGDFITVNSVLIKYRGTAEVLKESDFDPSIDSIGARAFMDSKVKEVNFPDRINYMGWGTFYECDTLERVKLPGMITFIPKNCFYECKKLTAIEAGENLQTIKYSAFEGTDSLGFLKVWNGVTTIEMCGLYGIRNIVLPKSIEKIEKYAFSINPAVNLYYEGTEAEWNGFLTVNGNEFLHENSQVYFFSERDPEQSGMFWHWVNGEPVIWEISETGESGAENAA